mgnify:FL=1
MKAIKFHNLKEFTEMDSANDLLSFSNPDEITLELIEKVKVEGLLIPFCDFNIFAINLFNDPIFKIFKSDKRYLMNTYLFEENPGRLFYNNVKDGFKALESDKYINYSESRRIHSAGMLFSLYYDFIEKVKSMINSDDLLELESSKQRMFNECIFPLQGYLFYVKETIDNNYKVNIEHLKIELTKNSLEGAIKYYNDELNGDFNEDAFYFDFIERVIIDETLIEVLETQRMMGY